MIPVIVTRKPGEPVFDEVFIDGFAQQHFDSDPRLQQTWGTVGMYQRALFELFIVPSARAEGYLFAEDGLTPVALVIYGRVIDPHYGLMAQPITLFTDLGQRGNLKVIRAVSELVKNVVRQMDVDWYSVSKHPTPDIQQSITRRINRG